MRQNPSVHYLGPNVGKIPLSTWDDIQRAAEGGQLAETQWVELKKQLRPTGREGNLELARDLASLSFEGGVLVIGVEDKSHAVVGCDVEGYRDRISQVAAMTVHPPLTPVIYPAIRNPEDTDRGVLIVEVPPSELAPHMVDGSYWGRSSDGKRKLGDLEVRLRMEARSGSAAEFKKRLLAMVEDDPLAELVEGHPTGNGHIFLLAEPCAPVLGRGDDQDLRYVLAGMVHDRCALGPLAALKYNSPDPQGPTVASQPPGTQVKREHEDEACYLQLRDEDSTLRYASGGGTLFRQLDRSEGPTECIGTAVIIQSTSRFFWLVRELSLKRWGYAGQWRVGIHVSNLAGKLISMDRLSRGEQTFSGNVFTNQMITSPSSWSDDAEPEARELLAGFLRAIGEGGKTLDTVRAY